MIKSALERLLDDNARFDLGARGTFNHLPMALVALSRIGATEERLIEYFRWWEENRALPRRDSDQQINRNDWQRYIGDARLSEALADCFRRWIVDRSSAEVVSTVLPQVSGGLAAAAFHGLICLAYGIEADHAGEIAGGLATLCSRYVRSWCQVDRAPPNISVEAALVRIEEALGGAVLPPTRSSEICGRRQPIPGSRQLSHVHRLGRRCWRMWRERASRFIGRRAISLKIEISTSSRSSTWSQPVMRRGCCLVDFRNSHQSMP
jgi:hypothetical protein